MEDEDFFEHDKFGVTDDDGNFTPYNEITCHDCGVPYGHIHRIGCDCEMCPKCGDQFISCSCGVKNGEKEYNLGKSVPEFSLQTKKELR